MTLPKFLTTREVADLLRVRERKIYELASSGEIPVSRATGKLLFPRSMVEMWVQAKVEYAGGAEALTPRPPVLAGSHDPLLEWALRESGSGIATFFDGSLDGLARVAEGRALAAGVHVYDPQADDWNRPAVERALPGMPVVLVEWARRRQGLVLPAGGIADRFGDGSGGVRSLPDLVGRRLIRRQPNAGSRLLFDHLLAQAGVDATALSFIEPPARSETDVANAVADGKVDAGFAIEAVARQFRLEFLPLAEERYDLLVWRRDYFEPPLQRLLDYASTAALATRARELEGYDVSRLGTVHYNAA